MLSVVIVSALPSNILQEIIEKLNAAGSVRVVSQVNEYLRTPQEYHMWRRFSPDGLDSKNENLIVEIVPIREAKESLDRVPEYDKRIWCLSAAAAAEDLLQWAANPTFYVSTRGKDGGVGFTFSDVVREGLAADGGLFVPRHIPKFNSDVLAVLLADARLSYVEWASIILEILLPDALPKQLRKLCHIAYATRNWTDKNICPVTPFQTAAHPNKLFLLELFHGPTAAFKDFALQLFPLLFSRAVQNEPQNYTILAATSGDTGVAAINGFMRNVPEVKVMVLYPLHGVSPVQQAQMVACDGPKVRVIGVESDFDFCQSTVKQIFNSDDVARRLSSEFNTVLSSANSINWGRLCPQVVYYFFGYAQLVSKRTIRVGDEIDVAVPTGNFGNLLAALIAKMMGLPLRKLVLGSNCNDVLSDFVTTGTYDIRHRQLLQTHSPSIDILRASNVERLLYILSGDPQLVSKCMNDLQSKSHFTVPDDVRSRISSLFTGSRCSEESCVEKIAEIHKQCGVLVDPHTAVGVVAAEKYLAQISSTIPLLVAATAHWAKFPTAASQALSLGDLTEPLSMYNQIREHHRTKFPDVSLDVPSGLVAALENDKHSVRTLPPDTFAVVNELLQFSESS